MADTDNKQRQSHILDDPSAQGVARVYAKSLLDAGQAAGVEHPLEELTSFHDDVLLPNPQFEEMLISPITGRDEKLGLIDRVVAPHASQFFTNFLKVLADRGRLELLPLILREAWEELEKRQGKVRVQVRSPKELSDSQLGRIKERLQSQLGKEPILIPAVDVELLGGLVIQIGDTVYDSSLRKRLKDLQTRLRERYLNEIQSGRNRFSHHE